jgi:D-psicose/D-tagatose/L-ribulose 3-epimerase
MGAPVAMRISLCNEVIAGLDFARQCDFVRAVGYDGIEIVPFTLGDEPHRLPAARRAEIGRIATDAGVAITGLHYLMVAPKGLSIAAADVGVRRTTLEVIRDVCELAADLGARLVIHDSPAQRLLESGDEANGWKRGVECFAAAAAAAEADGVVYLLEPLAREYIGFVNTVAEAVAHCPVDRKSGAAHRARLFRRRPNGGRTGRRCAAPVAAHRLDRTSISTIRTVAGQAKASSPSRQSWRRSRPEMVAVELFIYEPDGPTFAARAIGYLRGLLEARPLRPASPRVVSPDKA